MFWFLYSFWTQTDIDINRCFTRDNYHTAFSDPPVRRHLIRSTWMAGLVTLVTAALAYLVALRTRNQTFRLLLITVPFCISVRPRVFA